MQAQPLSVAATTDRLSLRVACLCMMVLLLEGYDIAAVGYAAPSLLDAWKIPPSELTQALTAGNVGLMIGSIGAGLLSDRVGRKPVLISCLVTFAAFSLLSTFATSPSQLGGLRFLTGLGLGGGLPVAVTLAASYMPKLSQARFLTFVPVAVPVGFSAGGIVASRLVHAFGWRAIFVAGGLLPLSLAPLLALWLPRSGDHFTHHRRTVVAALFKNGLAPTTLLLWAINALNLLGIYFFLLWLPSILHSKGVSSSTAILGTTTYGLGVIASPFVGALLVDRVGIDRLLACGLGLGALSVLSIGLLDPTLWLLLVMICGAGLGSGCQAGIISLSALSYPTAIRSTGAGWALGAGRIGTVAGPLLGGFLMGSGFSVHKTFLIVSIPAFAATLLMGILAGSLKMRET
jgi:MFS transporter, AAHS family, 4-hydroxybenzoate transporter